MGRTMMNERMLNIRR